MKRHLVFPGIYIDSSVFHFQLEPALYKKPNGANSEVLRQYWELAWKKIDH